MVHPFRVGGQRRRRIGHGGQAILRSARQLAVSRLYRLGYEAGRQDRNCAAIAPQFGGWPAQAGG